MNKLAFAIDIGNSCTKVAWRNVDGAVQLLHFDNLPYLPTLFYLPNGSDKILLGQEVERALKDEPLNVVSGLKRAIERNATIRVTQDRQVDPQALLVALFLHIKWTMEQEIEKNFGSICPYHVFFTVSHHVKEVMKTHFIQAAKAVSWEPEKINIENNLVAAVRYYFYGEGHNQNKVIILDIGSDSMDWALLKRAGMEICGSKYGTSESISKIPLCFESFLKESSEVPVLLVGDGATELLEKAISNIHPHVGVN